MADHGCWDALGRMSKPIALLDGDIFAFQSATRGEQTMEFWGGHTATTINLDYAKRNIEARIKTCLDRIGTDRVWVCLSDPGRRYFRHDLWPEYKGHRTGPPPALLGQMKQYLRDNYEVYDKPLLEADDVLGIIQTQLQSKGITNSVIVSTDKDMLQIPGFHLNSDHVDDGVFERTAEEGALWHLVQTLWGDSTDNYPGRKGTGEKRAPAIAKQGWAAVVEDFEKIGKTEEDALIQARLAKILHHTDWDKDKQEVIPWTPN